MVSASKQNYLNKNIIKYMVNVQAKLLWKPTEQFIQHAFVLFWFVCRIVGNYMPINIFNNECEDSFSSRNSDEVLYQIMQYKE